MVLIGTHNGAFHADDVFAVAMLKLWLFGKDVRVVRTRDMEVLVTCNIVVDVGGKYDKIDGWFDHHQKGGAGARPNGVPYASAGLIWAAIGADICGQKVADDLDKLVVQKIDAADCGYSAPGLDRTYSALVSDFNPAWNESNDLAAFDNAFNQAVSFAMTVLNNAIKHAVSKEGAKEIVMKAPVDDGLLILDEYTPWQDAVLEMPAVKAVVFPDLTDSWKVQVAPVKYGSFDSRIKLPASWSGAQFSELDGITGIGGCVFCHTGLFIAGNKTKEGVIAMARQAIAAAK